MDDITFKRLTLLNTTLLLVGIVLGIALVAAFYVPIMRMVDGFIQTERYSSEFVKTIEEKVLGESSVTKLPDFDIKVNPVNQRRIEMKSQELAKKGYMGGNDKLWVPATFYAGGKEYDVKIRTRGDLPNHWIRNKKSWRVRFKKDDLFKGYREINLIVPEDKQFSVEQAANQLARQYGLLAPDSGFSRVRINDVDYGLYFWVEHLSKQMLERQRYPEGELFSDKDVWLDNFIPPTDGASRVGSHEENYDGVPSYYKFRLTEDSPNSRIADRWRRFLKLTTEASDETLAKNLGYIVDLEKFAAWNAIAWAFGSTHAQYAKNLRWYYDTTTGLFEPMLYDLRIYSPPSWQASGKVVSSFEMDQTSPITKRMLSIPSVQARRNEILWEVVQDYDNLIYEPVDRIYRGLRSHLGVGVDKKFLYRADSQHANRLDFLRGAQRRLEGYFSFSRLFVDPEIGAKSGDSNLDLELNIDGMADIGIERIEISSTVALPFEMMNKPQVTLQQRGGLRKRVNVDAVSVDKNAWIIDVEDVRLHMERDSDLGLIPTTWSISITLDETIQSYMASHADQLSFAVTAKNLVTGRPIAAEHLRVSPIALRSDAHTGIQATKGLRSFLAESELPFQVDGQFLALKRGDYTVTRDIIIPDRLGLKLEAGVNLRISPTVSILTYGPLQVNGTQALPVRVRPATPSKPWGVLAVISAKARSKVEHLDIGSGSERWVNGIFCSGQICFYHSDVDITASTFRNAQADDGINIKHSDFSFTDSVLVGNSSDGFDGDWVTGTFYNSVVLNNGGDGVDVSGAQVVIDGTTLAGMGDKAVSVGEQSDVLIVDSRIEKSVIGVASKDLSNVHVYASSFYGNQTAIALYQKKPLFGSASAKVVATLFWENNKNFRLQSGSDLAVEWSALDAPIEDDRIASKELRIGGIGENYMYSRKDGVTFKGADDSKYHVTLRPEKETVLAYPLPLLKETPIGVLPSDQ